MLSFWILICLSCLPVNSLRKNDGWVDGWRMDSNSNLRDTLFSLALLFVSIE